MWPTACSRPSATTCSWPETKIVKLANNIINDIDLTTVSNKNLLKEINNRKINLLIDLLINLTTVSDEKFLEEINNYNTDLLINLLEEIKNRTINQKDN